MAFSSGQVLGLENPIIWELRSKSRRLHCQYIDLYLSTCAESVEICTVTNATALCKRAVF